MQVLSVVATIIALAAGVPAIAHHSFADYYLESETISLEGEVVEFQYSNPHAWLFVVVEGDDGEPVRYGAEWSNPNRLRRSGVSADTLRPGDRVILTGSPSRDADENALHLKALERPLDGWEWEDQRGRRGRRGR
jgi:hypothetical protein